VSTDDLVKYGGYHPKYEDEITYYNQNKVYAIQIEVNLACQQSCYYCYVSSKDALLKELPKKDVYAILDAASQMQVKAIDWLGGDPLLREDWFELMQYAKKNDLINNIWTSGIPLQDKNVAEKVMKVTENGFVSVHLDTLNETIYNQLHGGNAKRNINAILTGVDNLQQLGKKPEHMINCITFTKALANDAEKTISYFFNQNGMRTCLTQMCSEGDAKNHPDWTPSKEEIKHVCEIRDTINYPNSLTSMATMDVNKYYCGGMICVTIDGDVTPCSVIRKSYGNIKHDSLEHIVKEHKKELLFMHLREQKNLPHNCQICEHNSICWGCRAAAYYAAGDICDIDPNCYKKNR